LGENRSRERGRRQKDDPRRTCHAILTSPS
jgi:hypothetical protein